MTENPIAQECEKLREEVKESKKEFINWLIDFGFIIGLIIFFEFFTPDIWSIKDLGVRLIIAILIFNKYK